MGGAESRGVVVEENWPLGDPLGCDYEPCSWRVRSRFGESLDRNGYPLGIYRAKLEEREIEEDCLGIRAEEGVDLGRDDGRVVVVCVWRAGYGVGWCGRPRYHPRVGVWLLVVVVVDNVGSLISVVQRSPAGKGVVDRNAQAGRAQGGCAQIRCRHPCVP